MTIAVYFIQIKNTSDQHRNPIFYCSVQLKGGTHQIVKATHTYNLLRHNQRPLEGHYLGDFINYSTFEEYTQYRSEQTFRKLYIIPLLLWLKMQISNLCGYLIALYFKIRILWGKINEVMGFIYNYLIQLLVRSKSLCIINKKNKRRQRQPYHKRKKLNRFMIH